MKLKSITATAYSEFHGEHLHENFRGLTEGLNIRRLKHSRSSYCLDYACDTFSCGCGYPISHTRWEFSDPDIVVADLHECGRDGDVYGRGYLAITICHNDGEEVR